MKGADDVQMLTILLATCETALQKLQREGAQVDEELLGDLKRIVERIQRK